MKNPQFDMKEGSLLREAIKVAKEKGLDRNDIDLFELGIIAYNNNDKRFMDHWNALSETFLEQITDISRIMQERINNEPELAARSYGTTLDEHLLKHALLTLPEARMQ